MGGKVERGKENRRKKASFGDNWSKCKIYTPENTSKKLHIRTSEYWVSLHFSNIKTSTKNKLRKLEPSYALHISIYGYDHWIGYTYIYIFVIQWLWYNVGESDFKNEIFYAMNMGKYRLVIFTNGDFKICIIGVKYRKKYF